MSSEIHQQDHFYGTQFSLCSKIFRSVVLPSDINENWVPSLIFTVVITFGFYAQKYIGQQLLLPEQTRKRISACKKNINSPYDAYISKKEISSTEISPKPATIIKFFFAALNLSCITS